MITVFTDGQAADRGLVNSTFNNLSSQGTTILAGLTAAYNNSLTTLERRLSAVNARRQRANRTATLRTFARLETTDFQDIDQSETTATVRIDGGSITLRERNIPQTVSLATNVFTSDSGTINTFGTLFQVLSANQDIIPTGTFTMSLFSAVNASLLLFDIAATPSQPDITVRVSADGTTFVPATAIRLEGYRISAEIPLTAVKYITLSILPSHADDIDGATFTFGITDVSASEVQFQLSSEMSSRPILINPSSSSFQFVADADPGILFYLSLNGAAFFQVASGDTIPVPGAEDVNLTNIAMSTVVQGQLLTTLPDNTYPNSLTVTDVATGTIYPILPGTLPTLVGLTLLSGKYVAVFDNLLSLIPLNVADNPKTSDVSYTTGPASVSIQVRVVFTTADRTVTPVFRGAVFQEI
jgi:hypothetical protein